MGGVFRWAGGTCPRGNEASAFVEKYYVNGGVQIGLPRLAGQAKALSYRSSEALAKPLRYYIRHTDIERWVWN